MKAHTRIRTAIRLLTLSLLATTAEAHRSWILPSSTVFSGTDQWAVIDAAVSNDLFFPNHVAPDLDRFEIVNPEGKDVPLQNGMKGAYRTTFDVPLEVEGTYRIFQERSGVFAMWTEGEDRKRWRGTMEEFKTFDASGKEGFRASQRHSRVETFVTLGAPTTKTFTIRGKGLEFIPVTHPNDLYAGEEATFKLYFDGEPWVDGIITIIPGHDRYRDSVDAIEVTTDDKGRFTVKWPHAGRYWLDAEARPLPTDEPKDGRLASIASYTAVFEVLPL